MFYNIVCDFLRKNMIIPHTIFLYFVCAFYQLMLHDILLSQTFVPSPLIPLPASCAKVALATAAEQGEREKIRDIA